MRALVLLTSCCLLLACDTGTPRYAGIAPQRVDLSDMSFDVRVDGLMAEALRQGVIWPPSYEEVAIRAAEAMRRASGCEVLAVRGDPSIVEGRLKCGGQSAPKFPSKRFSKLVSCTFERVTTEVPVTIDDYRAVCV